MNERFREIETLLREEHTLTVAAMAEKLFVSAATVRRDLSEMEKLGIVQRAHGSASLRRNTDDESAFNARVQSYRMEKRRIAAAASALLASGTTVFLDSSSTVNHIIPFLTKFTDLTVVTNGIRTALELSKCENISVFVAGGELKSFSNSILGSKTLEFIDGMYYDAAVLSCSGIGENGFVTDGNSEPCAVKKLVANHSERVILLADSSKFSLLFMNKTFSFSEIDYFITDKQPPAEITAKIEAAGCKLLIR